jgi:hypothetical protein
MVMPSEQQQRTELTKDDDTNWILNKRENKKLWSSLLGISMSSYGNVLSGGSGSGGGGIDMPSYKIR